MPMRQLRQISLQAGRALLFGGCALMSVFLLASGYESLYNRSLPLVHTLDPVDLRLLAGAYHLDKAVVTDPSQYGTYGKPQTLKLPKHSLRLDIVPPIRDNGQWLARANTLHMLVPAPPRSGNLGVAFLYCRSSFRTLDNTNLPKEGDNILMDTDHDWRYVYKVTSAHMTPSTQAFVPSDGGTSAKLVIGCNDPGQQANLTIEANLLSVQGIEK